ncbi:hypothetical protein ACBP93_07930 [Paenalcaligenes hominis]|uniref:hypothetical protein n=1 Tax=Paenalcaligenes hominis TaxID=643674 RepID=UPI0035253467
MMKKSLLVVSSLVMSLGFHSAQAQNPTPQQAYNDAMAVCNQLNEAAAKQNCKRDAGAALQQAKRTPPAQISESTLTQNRIARCRALQSASAQEDCVAQMTGQIPSKEFGSVEGGGILRESTITIQEEPTSVAPTNPVRSIPTQPAPIR